MSDLNPTEPLVMRKPTQMEISKGHYDAPLIELTLPPQEEWKLLDDGVEIDNVIVKKKDEEPSDKKYMLVLKISAKPEHWYTVTHQLYVDETGELRTLLSLMDSGIHNPPESEVIRNLYIQQLNRLATEKELKSPGMKIYAGSLLVMHFEPPIHKTVTGIASVKQDNA